MITAKRIRPSTSFKGDSLADLVDRAGMTRKPSETARGSKAPSPAESNLPFDTARREFTTSALGAGRGGIGRRYGSHNETPRSRQVSMAYPCRV